jgi:hypothetical protein
VKTIIVSTAALLAVLGASAPASAQMRPQSGPLQDGAQPPSDLQGFQARQAQRHAEMASDLHVILHIRPDQEPALKTFLDEIRPAGPGQAPDPARVDAAYQSFSAVLTPDQQQVLQALRRLALERPHWGGRGMRHRDGGDGGEPQ